MMICEVLTLFVMLCSFIEIRLAQVAFTGTILSEVQAVHMLIFY